MALLQEPPAEGVEQLAEQALAKVGQFDPALAGRKLDLSQALPLFDIDLGLAGPDIAPAAALVHAGWRSLAMTEQGEAWAIDLALGPPARFSRIVGGGGITDLVELARIASAWAWERQGDYAARLIEADSCKLVAAWLHGKDDWFFVIQPGMRPGGRQPVQLPELLKLAAERFVFD